MLLLIWSVWIIVFLNWVPGHENVMDTKLADNLAKECSSFPFSNVVLYSQMCCVWHWVAKAHSRLWNVELTGRFTNSVLPKLHKKISNLLLSFSRVKIKTIARMQTLHIGLGYHPFRISRVEGWTCFLWERSRKPRHMCLVVLKFQIFGSLMVVMKWRLEMSCFVRLEILSC